MARRKRMRDPSVGARIKIAREAKGLTQEQLGRLCGWGDEAQARVSNYERGTREASYGDLRLMAEHLDRPVSWFVLGEHLDKLDEEEFAVLTKLRRMTTQQRQAVVQVVNTICPDQPDETKKDS
jgi:transcriptional regulator with XRE-family HTH domain